MDLDFLANFTQNNSNEELSYSKEDILKLLKRIGVDTRFVSYFNDNETNEIKLYVENFRFSKFSKKRVAYVENFRFSKFSKKRVATFNNYYVEVIRSSLFQKICLKSSKVLANSLKPKTNVIIPKITDEYTKLLYIILEPYSRKYGIKFIEYNEKINFNKVDAIISPLSLNEQVHNILTDIFNGDGIVWDKKISDLINYYNLNGLNNDILETKTFIFPLINVPQEWINDFLDYENSYQVDYETKDIASSFMGFLSEINPQFKENVLAASSFLENNQNYYNN